MRSMKSVIICSSKFIFCLLKVTRIWREPLRKYTFADKHITYLMLSQPNQQCNAVPCRRVEGGERTIIIFCSHKIDFVCRQPLRSEPQTTLFTPDYRIQSVPIQHCPPPYGHNRLWSGGASYLGSSSVAFPIRLQRQICLSIWTLYWHRRLWWVEEEEAEIYKLIYLCI